MKKILISLAILISAQSIVIAGGPWAKGKGNAYVKLSEWWTVFDQHYTDLGLLDPNVTTGIYNTNLFIEYGLNDNVTALFNGTLLSRNYMNNVRSFTTEEVLIEGEGLNSIGDIDIGVKYSFNKNGKVPVGLTAILGIPTGTTSGGAQGNLQTGDGEFNQLIQLDAGSGFNLGKTSAYLSGYLGINNRSKGFSEEFRYGLELGVGLLNRKLWVSGRMTGVESFNNGDTAATSSSTSIFANNSEFLSLGIEANYYVTDNLGVSVGVASAASGKIIAAAASYSVGVFYNLERN